MKMDDMTTSAIKNLKEKKKADEAAEKAAARRPVGRPRKEYDLDSVPTAAQRKENFAIMKKMKSAFGWGEEDPKKKQQKEKEAKIKKLRQINRYKNAGFPVLDSFKFRPGLSINSLVEELDQELSDIQAHLGQVDAIRQAELYFTLGCAKIEELHQFPEVAVLTGCKNKLHGFAETVSRPEVLDQVRQELTEITIMHESFFFHNHWARLVLKTVDLMQQYDQSIIGRMTEEDIKNKYADL